MDTVERDKSKFPACNMLEMPMQSKFPTVAINKQHANIVCKSIDIDTVCIILVLNYCYIRQ